MNVIKVYEKVQKRSIANACTAAYLCGGKKGGKFIGSRKKRKLVKR